MTEEITENKNEESETDNPSVCSADTSTDMGGNSIEKTYKITGMMCGHCEGRVKAALLEIPGVIEAEASCLHDCATVKMTEEISDETVIAAIEKAGYKMG